MFNFIVAVAVFVVLVAGALHSIRTERPRDFMEED